MENFSDTNNSNRSLDIEVPTEGEILLPPAGYFLAAAYLILLATFGVVLNLAVALIIILDKWNWRFPLNFILLNLAVSDLCMASIGASMSARAALNHGWHYSATTCQAYALVMSVTGIVSISSLTVLAMWRCAIIVFPLRRWSIGNREAFFFIVFIWIYSLSVAMPPILGWGRFGLEGAHISCSVAWQARDMNNKSYIAYLFFWGLFFPMSIIIVSYSLIVENVQQARAATVLRTSACAKAQKKVTLMVGVMIFGFLVAWMPYSVVSLVEYFSEEKPAIDPSTATAPALFAKSSCIMNPIIYGIYNTQFKSSWAKFGQLLKRPGKSNDMELDGAHRFNRTGRVQTTFNTSVTMPLLVHKLAPVQCVVTAAGRPGTALRSDSK